MSGQATILAEARAALRSHVRAAAERARLKYGLHVDAEVIVAMLADRDVVRWPTALAFDAASLRPGEFAWPRPLGAAPDEGFRLLVHPCFRRQPENWPLLVAYHIPTINYGAAAEAEHAELYGATLLGLDVETYYRALCELADSIR